MKDMRMPATEDAPTVVEEILRLEQVRAHALTSMDETALRQLLAEDLIYIHGSGKVDSKDSFVSSVVAGIARYHKMTFSDVAVRVHADTAIVHGTVHIDRGPLGEITTLNLRFTNVWVKETAGWHNIHWHSSKI